MSRFRPAVVAACLTVLLASAQSGTALAQRGAGYDQAVTESGSVGERLIGAALDWGRSTLLWFQALIAADHGTVVPAPPPAPRP